MNAHPSDTHNYLPPSTGSLHRKQTMWQITAPLGVMILVVLALAVLGVLAAQSSADEATRWAGISLVVMILPAMVITLVVLAIFVGLIILLAKLLKVTPFYSLRVRALIFQVEAAAIQWMDRSVKPVMFLNSTWAAIQQFVHQIKNAPR